VRLKPGRPALSFAAVAAALLLSAPSGADAFETGFADGLYTSSDPSVRGEWLDRTVDVHSGLVRLNPTWRAIAGPSPPADPSDPADPSYDFSSLDAAVQSASSRGLKVLITIYDAPAWAEGPHRPGNAAPGTWKPDPGKFRQFATAVASRYSGSFLGLPRVRYFQALNEPNLSVYLTPQYKGRHARAPRIYKRLLNAFYEGVKSVHGDNVVLTAGTAPYGDPPGGERTKPIAFWRKVFCLRGRRALRPYHCSAKPHFDVFAHHPIDTSGGPHTSAVDPDNAATPDFKNVVRVLRKAERVGHAKGSRHHPAWATELWWASDPPDHHGVPVRKHAHWLEEALYVLWKQGARVVINLQIRDGRFRDRNQFATGIYFHSGKAKPAKRAWSFPFVAHHRDKARVHVWGKAPASGSVSIERRRHGNWRTLKTLNGGGIFRGDIHLRGSGPLRARNGGEHSLAWRVR
jgi:hypothetical protein